MDFDAASQALVAGATSTGGDETPLLRTVSADEEDVEPIDCDVLSERGGKGYHHPGNIRYREKVREMMPEYENECKTRKTKIAEEIVEYVHSHQSGRFLKKDEDGQYYVMTYLESRRKTNQALRDAVLSESRKKSCQALREKQSNRTHIDVEEDVEEKSRYTASAAPMAGAISTKVGDEKDVESPYSDNTGNMSLLTTETFPFSTEAEDGDLDAIDALIVTYFLHD
jgi:hypothetical protein